MLVQTETNLFQTYVMIGDLANILSIYTGLSGVAIVHSFVWMTIAM